MIDITAKINAIKESAKNSLTDQDDFYDEVIVNLQAAEKIRENNKLHNDDKSKELLEKLKEDRKFFLDKKEQDDPEYGLKEYLTDIKKAYITYAKANARLDRLGKAIVFLDVTTERFIRIIRYINVDRSGKKHERLRTDRITSKTVNSFIDAECKALKIPLLKSDDISYIKRELGLFFKEFEPLKPRFYGEFFNTYTPHGFLDVRLENKINIEKFTNITLPKRYPIINALMQNIAPDQNERIYLLNWLSTIFNTSEKTKTAPVLKGIQRTGKGVFATQIIEYAMHEANCFIATNANLSDKFNTYLEDKLFITFDEVKGDFKTQNDIGNIIKQIVSEDKLSIRAMNTDPYMITSFANCIFLSNDDLPIPMDQSDGRFTIIETRSRKLITVAKEDFDLTIEDFLKKLKAERDHFIIHLKMCKFDRRLATSTIENKAKKVIQDATATHEAVLKTAFQNQDVEIIEDILDEAIQDVLTDTLIKRETEVHTVSLETGDTFKTKKTTPFNHNNKKMQELFLQEFKSAFMSNTSLKWFSKALNLEHILKDDKKFGSFWNKVLSGAVTVNLKLNPKISTKETKIKEKFRQLRIHDKITEFNFDGMNFSFITNTTATQL